MTLRRKIVLVIVSGVVVIVGVGFFCLREKEPSYNGRTLSEWLRQYDDSNRDSPKWEEARQAVLGIGTNSIPFLLKWTTVQQAQRHQKFLSFWTKLPEFWINRSAVVSIAHKTMGNVILAQEGFRILGTNAASAIPELSRRFYNSTNEDEARLATVSLQRMGIPGFNFFVEVLRNGGTKGQRLMVTGAIGLMHYLGTNTVVAVPLLIVEANGSDEQVSDKAARSLGYLGLCPDEVVPILTQKLSSTNESVRLDAMQALFDFGNAAKPAVPSVKITLDDRDDFVRQAATNCLLRIAPEVLTNSAAATN